MPTDQPVSPQEVAPPLIFSWWSWRPGVKPQSALVLGGLLALIGLLLSCIGLFLLFFGIWDHFSPLQKTSAIVFAHHPGHPPTLSLKALSSSPPTLKEILVPQTAFDELANGSLVSISYTKHLQVPLFLESASGKRYTLSETSSLENPGNILFLLVPGLLLFGYPALLAYWGWRDLFIERFLPTDIIELNAEVVGKRTLNTGQYNRRGRINLLRSHIWNGVALRASDPIGKQRVLTFRVDQERFAVIEEGAWVSIRYSPHLYYVYALIPLSQSKQ